MAFLSTKEIVVNTDELLLGHAQFCDYAGSGSADVETESKEAMETVSTEEKSIIREFLTGFQIGLYGRASGGHVIAGYEFVLESGLDGLKNAAVEVMEDDSLSDGSQKRIVAGSFLLVYEAASCYIERYARAAENAGLEELAVACRKIAHVKLTAKRKTLNQRYLALKEEVKEAEKIRKSVYSILQQERWEW